MKKIEVGKSYKTRNGRQVRIYAIDGSGGQPVHGAILSEGEWSCQTWDVQGQFLEGETSILDVIIPPLKYEGVARIDSYFEGCNPKIYVPIEFAGLEVKFTLEVLDEKS